jgi:hypothetical protein
MMTKIAAQPQKANLPPLELIGSPLAVKNSSHYMRFRRSASGKA